MSIYTPYDLINDLKQIIENNPTIDFNKIDISMNMEYTCRSAELSSWKRRDGEQAHCIELSP